MNRLILRLLYVMPLPLIILCTNPGGTGTETTTGVVGLIVNSQGAGQAHVQVRLLADTYNPVQGNKSILTDTTDSLGRYAFLHLDSGSYSLQAIQLSERTRALTYGIRIRCDTVVEAALTTLHPPGSLRVYLPLNIINALGYVYIRGTTIFTRVNGSVDFVEFDSLPAGKVPAITWLSSNHDSSSTLVSEVQVYTGDTVMVRSAAWSHSRVCALNTSSSGAGVTATVTDFPVLLRFNAGNFDFTQTRPGGADIRFSRKQGKFLPYEVERWDPVNQLAEVWVKVDTVYGNDPAQFITMYWGNTDAADSSAGAAVFDTSNGFVAVWHMNEDPSAGAASIKDRTGSMHDATPYGSMTAANIVDGEIGKALNFDGVDDYLNAGNVSVAGTYTIGLWVQMNTIGDYERFIYKDSSYTLWYDKDSVSVRMEHMSSTTWWKGLLQDGGTRVPMTTGTWYYLTATFDGTVIRLYKNGSEASVSNPINVIPRTNTKPLVFGKSLTGPFVNGVMDEIRIEGIARSADWIKLCYMNQRPDNRLVNFR